LGGGRYSRKTMKIFSCQGSESIGTLSDRDKPRELIFGLVLEENPEWIVWLALARMLSMSLP
jgi:hypothetical protein